MLKPKAKKGKYFQIKKIKQFINFYFIISS